MEVHVNAVFLLYKNKKLIFIFFKFADNKFRDFQAVANLVFYSNTL